MIEVDVMYINSEKRIHYLILDINFKCTDIHSMIKQIEKKIKKLVPVSSRRSQTKFSIKTKRQCLQS